MQFLSTGWTAHEVPADTPPQNRRGGSRWGGRACPAGVLSTCWLRAWVHLEGLRPAQARELLPQRAPGLLFALSPVGGVCQREREQICGIKRISKQTAHQSKEGPSGKKGVQTRRQRIRGRRCKSGAVTEVGVWGQMGQNEEEPSFGS